MLLKVVKLKGVKRSMLPMVKLKDAKTNREYTKMVGDSSWHVGQTYEIADEIGYAMLNQFNGYLQKIDSTDTMVEAKEAAEPQVTKRRGRPRKVGMMTGATADK